ncbi:MAG: gliding motility protein GldC [Flavobacteriales bacterium]|nr:gliding motility protein GldC [Flavobacteriales bacterium]
MSKKKSEINIQVSLDDHHLPETIVWKASDADMKDTEQAKALMMSVWDEKTSNSMRIDLWTKDMLVDEMKLFFFQTLVAMADTLEKSTGENNLAEDLRDYCAHFAEKSGFTKG